MLQDLLGALPFWLVVGFWLGLGIDGCILLWAFLVAHNWHPEERHPHGWQWIGWPFLLVTVVVKEFWQVSSMLFIIDIALIANWDIAPAAVLFVACAIAVALYHLCNTIDYKRWQSAKQRHIPFSR